MAKRKSKYGVHPGVAMVQQWIAELKVKTGRSLDEWLTTIEQDGPTTEAERRDWLKNHFGLGTNAARWLAERSLGKGADEDSPDAYLQAAEGYVEAMFAGKKAGLAPIFDALLEKGLALGKDVKACPCKTMVPLYRHHVFAQIKPTTNTRIDLGFALKDRKATGRLIDTGGYAKKDRITHRIALASIGDIGDDVDQWLRIAYDLDS